MFQELYTKEGKNLQGIPWEIYPRPQLVRDAWQCLNGKWDIAILRNGASAFQGKIRVPFCVESLLSGVKLLPEKEDLLVYRRELQLPERDRKSVV